jgi:hypothetical protein
LDCVGRDGAGQAGRERGPGPHRIGRGGRKVKWWVWGR